MSQISINYIVSEPTISDTETLAASPTGVTWFIDRNGYDNTINNNIYFGNYMVNEMRRNINNENITSLYEIPFNYNYDTSGNMMFNELELNKNIEIIVNEDIEVTEEQRECCICMETKEKSDICRINCAHTFCVDCCQTIANKFRNHEILKCPLCRTDVTSIQVKNIESKDKFL